MSRVPTSISLPEDIHELAKTKAKEKDISISQYIARIIQKENNYFGV